LTEEIKLVSTEKMQISRFLGAFFLSGTVIFAAGVDQWNNICANGQSTGVPEK
jgi:hypothetical protein